MNSTTVKILKIQQDKRHFFFGKTEKFANNKGKGKYSYYQFWSISGMADDRDKIVDYAMHFVHDYFK